MNGQWNHKIFSVNKAGFDTLALEIFRFQYENNPVYNAYTRALGINVLTVNSLAQIPFLPISFFKTHKVATSAFEPQAVFESSGTTGVATSRHYIKDLLIYEESFLRGFELFYGPVNEWCIIGLLPSYLERENSSLVYMVNKLIGLSGNEGSGFYLDQFNALKNLLLRQEEEGKKTLLIGVTFALLDFAESFSFPLKHTVIMETGGMKGRRKEMIREDVHSKLKQSFQIASIHSEYGMTELLSQAYSKGNGFFQCPPWMKIMVRDEDDPFNLHDGSLLKNQSNFSGALNVIDLANVYSCSFIATDDVGKLYKNGSF
ncbi:MAG: acyl transferase, partial [Bacteroidota bacterium]